MKIYKVFGFFLELSLFLLIFPKNVFAQITPYAGTLDPGFGTAGIKLTDLPGTAGSHDVLLQPDGKIIEVGESFDPTLYPTLFVNAFTVIRHNPDGSLDSSFANGGVFVRRISKYAYGDDSARSVAIQPDGKIVVAGFGIDTDAYKRPLQAIVVLRFNPDGTLDNAFDNDGVVMTDLPPNGRAFSVAIQPDGKIVVGGDAIIRYLSNGSLDSSFGVGGIVRPIFWVNSVKVSDDGKILATGWTNNGSINYSDVYTIRLNSDGSLDNTFGGTGQVIYNFAPYYEDNGYGLFVQSDGRVVVVGRSANLATGSPASQVLLFRYNTDGSLDSMFGNSGVVTTNITDSINYGFDLVEDSEGRLVVVGQTQLRTNGGTAYHGIFVARYLNSGVLDTCFGTGGKVITTYLPGWPARAFAVALQPDGNIVVGGTIYLYPVPTNHGYTFATLRYFGGNVCQPDHPPVANAGNDQMVNEGKQVTLNGSGSTDPDGDPLTYNWSLLSYQGPQVTLSSNNVSNPSFQTYDNGTYTFRLTVDDGRGGTSTDDVTINVFNTAPTIDQIVGPLSPQIIGELTEVDANFSDPGILDTHTSSWDWGDGSVTGGDLIESNGSGSVTGSHTYNVSGTYTITLTVADKDGGVGTGVFQVTIQTPVEATQSLIDLVQAFNLQQGIENSLDAKLEAVVGALSDLNVQDDVAAVNSLNAFISAVQAQSGNKLTVEQADALIQAAGKILLYI